MTDSELVTGTCADVHRPLPKAELHVHHVGSASARIVGELAERHPGVVPSDPDAAARLLRVPRLRALRRGLPRGRRPDPHRRGRPVPHLRGGPRDGRGPADPVRRADVHAVHVRDADGRHPDRGLHGGHRGRPDRRRARLRPGAALDLRHPGGERRAGGRRDARLRPGPPGGRSRRLRARRAGDRRASRAVPAALRRAPAPPACTASRTPARRPGPRRSGSRCACSAPSGSGTAPPRPRTRRCSRTSPRPGSRSRSARRPTSRPARSPRWPSTRCGVRRGRRHGDDQLRRPADVRHHPQPGVRRRRRPARTSTRPASPTWRARRSARRSRPTTSRPGCWRRSTPLDLISSMEDN